MKFQIFVGEFETVPGDEDGEDEEGATQAPQPPPTYESSAGDEKIPSGQDRGLPATGPEMAGPSRTASLKHEKKVMSAMSQITSAKKAQKSTRESMSKTAGISKVEKQSTKPVRMSTFFTDLLKIMN